MSTSHELRLVLVTPEKTLLDEPVERLRFPLFDGQIGVLIGRAPMVGRLGYGELKIDSASESRSYYIDGGFVQVKGSVVSILTNRALTAADIDREAAQKQLEDALARVPKSDLEFAAKDRDQQRARNLLAMSRERM